MEGKLFFGFVAQNKNSTVITIVINSNTYAYSAQSKSERYNCFICFVCHPISLTMSFFVLLFLLGVLQNHLNICMEEKKNTGKSQGLCLPTKREQKKNIK